MWHAKHATELKLPTSWQQIPNGTLYCNALNRYFSHWLSNILGDQILKLGGLSAEIGLDLPMCHQLVISPEIPRNLTALCLQPGTSVVRSKVTELPLIEESIDACLLANNLNFCADPHRLLREITRVTTESGLLFISLFNPLSILAFKRQFHQTPYEKFPFRQYPTWLIIDWLELLNFDILQCENLALQHRQHFSLFSPLTVIIAQKRTCSLSSQAQKIQFHQEDVFSPEAAFKRINE